MQNTNLINLEKSLNNAKQAINNGQTTYRDVLMAYHPNKLGNEFNTKVYRDLYQDAINATLSLQATQNDPNQTTMIDFDLPEFNFTYLLYHLDQMLGFDPYADAIEQELEASFG